MLCATAESELQTLQEEYSAKRHRHSTLLELEEKRAVYTPQVQKLFAEEKNIGVRLAGVLADRLNVAREAETAVETLFGNFLEAVVVESMADAKRLSDLAKGQRYRPHGNDHFAENGGSAAKTASA